MIFCPSFLSHLPFVGPLSDADDHGEPNIRSLVVNNLLNLGRHVPGRSGLHRVDLGIGRRRSRRRRGGLARSGGEGRLGTRGAAG